MNITEHFAAIRNDISLGKFEDAVEKLKFLTNKSKLLDAVLLQQSRLNDLNRNILSGFIAYQEETSTRAQITQSLLSLVREVEEKIAGDANIKNELELSVGEFIRKFGLDKNLIERFISGNLPDLYQCLWVDDNPDNDKIELNILASLNIKCITARDPYDAYRILKNNMPNIIVMNSLSRLRDNPNEGIEFCDFLFKHKEYSSIPVIMHSISLQKRLEHKEKIHFPQNIKNNFKKKNALIIKDLIEEIIVNIK